MLRKGEQPDILKIAKAVSLHKGGSKETLSNYRQIPVLIPINNIYKTFLKSVKLNFGKGSVYFLIINLGSEKNI